MPQNQLPFVPRGHTKHSKSSSVHATPPTALQILKQKRCLPYASAEKTVVTHGTWNPLSPFAALCLFEAATEAHLHTEQRRGNVSVESHERAPLHGKDFLRRARTREQTNEGKDKKARERHRRAIGRGKERKSTRFFKNQETKTD